MVARRQRSKNEKPRQSVKRRGEKMQKAKRSPDRNQRRRLLYASDPAYRARVLRRQREHYSRTRGSQESKLKDGVLCRGIQREIDVDGLDDIVVLESYTLRQTGDALGRSILTIRTWIKNGIIPEPFCTEAATGYKVYARFELDVMAEILADHETHSQYVSADNEELVGEFHECVEAVRQGFLDSE